VTVSDPTAKSAGLFFCLAALSEVATLANLTLRCAALEPRKGHGLGQTLDVFGDRGAALVAVVFDAAYPDCLGVARAFRLDLDAGAGDAAEGRTAAEGTDEEDGGKLDGL